LLHSSSEEITPKLLLGVSAVVKKYHRNYAGSKGLKYRTDKKNSLTIWKFIISNVEIIRATGKKGFWL
jgi:hypothetical protein